MSPDLLEYLNGNIPMGVWVIPFIGVIFTFIWWVSWKGTKFWSPARFWKVLIIGWVIIVAIYSTFWKLFPPQPIPTRVIVLAGDPGEKSPGAWADGCAEGIRSALSATEKCLTVLLPETAPSAFAATSDAELEPIASRMRVKYIISIRQTSIDPTTTSDLQVSIRELSGAKKYRTILPPTSPAKIQLNNSTRLSRAMAGAWDLVSKTLILESNLGPKRMLNDSLDVMHYAMFAQRRFGKTELAAAFFRSEAAFCTTCTAPRIEMARTWLKAGPGLHEEEIRTALLEAAVLDRKDPEIYILLGRHFLEFRDWEEAESALKLAYMLDPDDPRIYFYMSRLMENRLTNLPLKTRRALIERALQLSPGYETARLGWIENMRAVYNKREISEVIMAGLQVDPTSRPLLVAASAFYIEIQIYREATRYCERLLAENPRDNEALYNLGLCKLWQKKYDESIALFDSSRQNGGSIENLYYCGVANQLKKDYPEAIEWFQKRFALSKGPDDQGAISSRARIEMLRDRMVTDSMKAEGHVFPSRFEDVLQKRKERKEGIRDER